MSSKLGAVKPRGAAGTRGSSKESRRGTSDTSYYQRQKRSDGSNPPTASSLRSETLRRHWTNDDCGRGVDRLAAGFRQARTEALDSLAVHGSSMFTGKQVAGALRAMRPERVCGLDSWIPSDWPNLPMEVRNDIAAILTKCEKGPAWPLQVMQNAVALLGKFATDD